MTHPDQPSAVQPPPPGSPAPKKKSAPVECGGLVPIVLQNDPSVNVADVQKNLDSCQFAWQACKREQESGQIYSDPNRFLAFNALRGFTNGGFLGEFGNENGGLFGRSTEFDNFGVAVEMVGMELLFGLYGVNFTVCRWYCWVAVGSTALLGGLAAGSVCAASAGFACTASFFASGSATSVVWEATSNPSPDGGDLLCSALFGPSDPIGTAVMSATSYGTSRLAGATVQVARNSTAAVSGAQFAGSAALC